MKYDSVEYASSRLVGTLVTTKDNGIPFLIQDIYHDSGDKLFAVGTNPRFPAKHLEYDIDNLSLVTPPLGYIQKNETAFWVCRTPRRDDYRQGIRPNSLSLTTKGHNRFFNFSSIGNYHFSLEDLWQCISHVYPSANEAIEMAEDYFDTVPFHRNFAVSGDRLYYCGKICVGRVSNKGYHLVLDDDWKFLEEELQEAITGSFVSPSSSVPPQLAATEGDSYNVAI